MYMELHDYAYVYRTKSISEYCLFYRAVLQKEPDYFKEPTNRSHPISVCLSSVMTIHMLIDLTQTKKTVEWLGWIAMGWLRLVGSFK